MTPRERQGLLERLRRDLTPDELKAAVKVLDVLLEVIALPPTEDDEEDAQHASQPDRD